MNKLVLAYSGGVDTTAALHWLTRQRGFKVVALTLDLGQGSDMEEVSARALQAGAESVHIVDKRAAFARHFCFRALRAGARYEGVYYLSAALSRPLIATELVRYAHDEGARFVAHGAPPRGNDQFRFECSVAALDPHLTSIAPLRQWELRSRAEIIQYAKLNRLSFGGDAEISFSTDRNLWGTRTGGGILDDPTREPPESAYQVTVSPKAAPEQPELVEIQFEYGEPVQLNGEELEPEALILALERKAGRHGIGRFDTMEDRVLGFKSREVYEAPAAHVLHVAHEALEQITLDHEMRELKAALARRYARLVYDSQWFSNARESLDAFFKESQRFVCGKVKLELYRGNARVVSRASEFSIYDRESASLHDSLAFSSEAVGGYLELRRLAQQSRAFRQRPKV